MTSILLAASLWMAAAAGFSVLRQSRIRWFDGRPLLTVGSAVVVAAASVAQLTVAPGLLPALMRSGPRFVATEPWRLVTSMLVQDGGWPGFAFNIVGLLVVGSLAERLLGRLRWVVIAAISVVAAQAVALVWQPMGAGNSILNFGLAGGVCARGLRCRPRAPLLPALVALVSFTALLLGRDIHGVAALTGAVAAYIFGLADDHVAPSDSRR